MSISENKKSKTGRMDKVMKKIKRRTTSKILSDNKNEDVDLPKTVISTIYQDLPAANDEIRTLPPANPNLDREKALGTDPGGGTEYYEGRSVFPSTGINSVKFLSHDYIGVNSDSDDNDNDNNNNEVDEDPAYVNLDKYVYKSISSMDIYNKPVEAKPNSDFGRLPVASYNLHRNDVIFLYSPYIFPFACLIVDVEDKNIFFVPLLPPSISDETLSKNPFLSTTPLYDNQQERKKQLYLKFFLGGPVFCLEKSGSYLRLDYENRKDFPIDIFNGQSPEVFPDAMLTFYFKHIEIYDKKSNDMHLVTPFYFPRLDNIYSGTIPLTAKRNFIFFKENEFEYNLNLLAFLDRTTLDYLESYTSKLDIYFKNDLIWKRRITVRGDYELLEFKPENMSWSQYSECLDFYLKYGLKLREMLSELNENQVINISNMSKNFEPVGIVNLTHSMADNLIKIRMGINLPIFSSDPSKFKLIIWTLGPSYYGYLAY